MTKKNLFELSSSLIIHERNKGNHYCEGISLTIIINYYYYYQCFGKLCQTLERVFHQISKHFRVGYKKPAAPRFFNPLLSVWISDKTLFFVVATLLLNQQP